MSEPKTAELSEPVKERWIKPPELVVYTNSRLIKYRESLLVCEFYFPKKYSEHDFYLDGKKVLKKGEMYLGRRYFYGDRYYSLLEFYSKKGNLTAYYLDITLPPIIERNEILIADLKVDFFVFPDKMRYIILDEDELEAAIEKKLFTAKEIDSCNWCKEFIIQMIESKNFDRIFEDYKTSDYKEWRKSYTEYL